MTTIMSRAAAKSWWGVDLPLGVISLSRTHPHTEWIEFTKSDLVKRKIRKQESNLLYLRRGKAQIPCFVWIFYNKSILFGGWHIYVKTAYKDYPLNFRHDEHELIVQAMALFPCGFLPLISLSVAWMSYFVKQYPHIGFKRGLRGWKQGLAQCWCLIDENKNLTDIYSMPKTRFR